MFNNLFSGIVHRNIDAWNNQPIDVRLFKRTLKRIDFSVHLKGFVNVV